ncbi:hypothetical protein [Glutamicibacter sp. TV12E]|uniref:hypothetical protein n=1 Tax=Glutamicibacter sp. TV12E TaxID=3446362 RepID=UPI004033A48D
MAKPIEQLITELRGRRTYKELSDDCDGIPSTGRLSAMVKEGIESYPAMNSIRGLAKGLSVTEQDIVDACSVSLGFLQEGITRQAIALPNGAEKLTDSQKALVVSIVREFITANKLAS